MRALALRAWLHAILAIAGTFPAAAAHAQEPPAGAMLPGTLRETTWHLVEMDGQAPDPDLPPVTLLLGPARAEGSGGCNWYTAWLESPAAGRVAVSYLTATGRDCVHPRIMDHEARYMEALEKVQAYRLDGDWLVLATGAAPSLVFRRE